MDSHRSVGHEPETRPRKMIRRCSAPMLQDVSMTIARRCSVLLFAAVLAACSSHRRPAAGGGYVNTVNVISPATFQYASDAVAIKAMLDTSAAGWNRGQLPVYLSAYVDSATAMGSAGLVRGVRGIEGQMRAGYWRTGRPLQVLRYDHLEIRPIGPSQAIVTGQYILTGAGSPNRTGWFTTIWVRTRAGWRMVHDHSS
jgi:ketosteroid isomerase-like protein